MRKMTSINYQNEKYLQHYCQAARTLCLIQGRWKLNIIFLVMNQILSYQQIKGSLRNVSDTVLSRQLNELIKDNIISKEKYKDSSLYKITSNGKKLEPVLICISPDLI